MTKWLKKSDGPFLCLGDQILGCPMRQTVPFTDTLPLNHTGRGSPTGNGPWVQEGGNGVAELPVVRRWGVKPHCLPAQQHISRALLE